MTSDALRYGFTACVRKHIFIMTPLPFGNRDGLHKVESEDEAQLQYKTCPSNGVHTYL